MFKNFIRKLMGRPAVISFKQAIDLVELPVVTFYQGKHKLNFILDTGSSHCIIDRNTVSKIEYEKLAQESSLYGLEGNRQEAEMCSILLSLNSCHYLFNYLICDMSKSFGAVKQETGVTVHGILGSDFFQKFRYVLDFDKLIAYSNK